MKKPVKSFIPRSVKNNFLKIPANKTPFKNIFLPGILFYPGQVTPAVVHGVLSVAAKILDY